MKLIIKSEVYKKTIITAIGFSGPEHSALCRFHPCTVPKNHRIEVYMVRNKKGKQCKTSK